MPEVTPAELRKLRALEDRIVAANETLGECRAKRKELQAQLTATRRDLRQAERRASKLERQVAELVGENARIAAELDDARADVTRVVDEAGAMRGRLDELGATLATSRSDAGEARKLLAASERTRARLEKQLATVTDKLEGNEAPELTPEHLSDLLREFLGQVGGQTGLQVVGSRINLKVGFSGRGGGSFVVPAVGVDPATLPELHEVQLDLTRGGLEGGGDAAPD